LREKRCTRALVLDASALFSSVQLLVPDCLFTTVQVYDEVLDQENYERTALSVDLKRLTVVAPPDIELGLPLRLLKKLSEADVSLLKLSCAIRREGVQVTLVTDDYALQEAAQALGIDFMPVKTAGIKRLTRL